MSGSSLRFAEVARALAGACRAGSIRAPAFRSPPRIDGDRSIRRRADGGATVAVRYRDRPWPAVLADMVEGVVVTNNLDGARADSTRSSLWAMLEGAGLAASTSGDKASGAGPSDSRLRAVA